MKIAIIIEGGIVQAVLTDDATNYPLDVTVVDYDCEGADEDELTQVRQDDLTYSEAIVRKEVVELAPDFFDRLATTYID